MEKAEELARYEVGWWKAHHEKDFDSVLENMSKEYSLLFGIPYSAAKLACELRTEATKYHDKAEKLQDAGREEESKEFWKKAEDVLVEHFKILLESGTYD